MLSANDMTELEKKYSKYILKKRVKLFSVLVIFLSIIAFVLYYLLYVPNTSKKVLDANKTFIKVIKKTNSAIKLKDTNLTKTKKILTIKKDNNITKKIIKIKKNISKTTEKAIKADTNISNTNNNLEKKFIFHIKPQYKTVTNTKLTPTLKLNRYFLNKEYKIKKQKNINSLKNSDKNGTIVKTKHIKQKIHIEMRDIDTTEYLKEKFQKTHDIAFALMLCKNYYSQKNYKESLKWSIMANDIDNKNEQSWIWFAKSKYRLNKKNDAIKALKAFLESNESKSIRLLLKDIINGEMND